MVKEFLSNEKKHMSAHGYSIFILISVPQICIMHTKHQQIRFCITSVISAVIAVVSVARSSCMSLNLDVAHSFDVFAPIVEPIYVSTRVGIVRISCCANPIMES